MGLDYRDSNDDYTDCGSFLENYLRRQDAIRKAI